MGRRGGPFYDFRFFDYIDIDTLPGHAYFLVGCDEYRTSEFFGQIKGLYGKQEAILNIYRCQYNRRQTAAVAPAQKIDIPVSAAGSGAGGGAQSLYVHYDDGNFAANGKGNILAVKADAGSGCSRHSLQAGHGRSQAAADGGNFILTLKAYTAQRGQQF